MTATRPGAESAAAASAAQPGIKPASATSRAEPPRPAIPQLARILAGIVAPSTLVTALLYYFGWLFAYWFFRYFGVDSSVLGLSPADYLIRGANVLFIPMTVASCLALLAFWGDAALRARLTAGSRPGVLGVVIPALTCCGLALSVAGFASIFGVGFLTRFLAGAPLGLAVGVGMVEYSIRLRRLTMPVRQGRTTHSVSGWAPLGEWGVVFALVSLSLFGAATDYAHDTGIAKARHFAANLGEDPAVLVYSQESLSLHAPGVAEVRCRNPHAAYHYRYTGLTLMLQSDSQYLFVPSPWQPGNGAAILIPRSDALRLEFYPGPLEQSRVPPGC